nr:LuxR family transcriptional regulator [Haloferula luteola]
MQTDGQLTRSRQQTDPDNLYRKSSVRALWEAAGVEPGLLSCKVLNPSTVSGVAIYRRPKEPLFEERERLITHILLTEVPWLHQPTPEDVGVPVRKLSPRRLTICNLLAQGMSRAAIAEHLGIKESTVNSYTKEIFKVFGVHSQPELMTRLHADDHPADS